MHRPWTSSGRGRPIIVALTLLATLLALAACGTNPSAAQPGPSASATLPTAKKNDAIAAKLPAAIRQKGTLVVVMSVTSPPVHYYADDGKTIVGLDPDLARALGQVLGLKVDIQGVELKQLIPGMQAGRYDLAVSQLSPTKARQEVLDFFDYFKSGTELAVKKGNPSSLNMATATSLCGRTLALETGSVQEQKYFPAVNQQCTAAGKDAIKPSGFPDKQSATLAVVSGRADAVLTDSPAVDYMVKKTGQIEGAGMYNSGPVGAGTLKGSGLLDPVREALLDLMKQGVYTKILAKWGLQAGAIKDPIVNDPNG